MVSTRTYSPSHFILSDHKGNEKKTLTWVYGVRKMWVIKRRKLEVKGKNIVSKMTVKSEIDL